MMLVTMITMILIMKDAVGRSDADDDYYDHDYGDSNNEFDARKFHGDATRFNYDDYNEEFNGMRFYGVNKSYEIVCEY